MTSTTTPVSAQREPELAGQTVVVIGDSAGIGLETSDDPRCGRPSPPSGLQEGDNGR